MEMKKRSIAGCIILTFVTLGIYGIYWFVKLTNETNRLAPEEATAERRTCISRNGLHTWYLRTVLGIQARQEDGYHFRKIEQLRDHLPAAFPPGLRHHRQGACTE